MPDVSDTGEERDVRLRTTGEFIAMACMTPKHEPVGLTHLEIRTLEDLTGNCMAVTGVNTLIGRRIVAIPWDWERNW